MEGCKVGFVLYIGPAPPKVDGLLQPVQGLVFIAENAVDDGIREEALDWLEKAVNFG